MNKILIVNDTASINRFLKASLESEGFSVDAVLTGTEGIARSKEAPYDVILLDYNLPDINGDQVCNAIKSQPHQINTPVYFISALDKETLGKVIKDTGAQGYLDVAVDVEELARQLKNIMGA